MTKNDHAVIVELIEHGRAATEEIRAALIGNVGDPGGVLREVDRHEERISRLEEEVVKIGDTLRNTALAPSNSVSPISTLSQVTPSGATAIVTIVFLLVAALYGVVKLFAGGVPEVRDVPAPPPVVVPEVPVLRETGGLLHSFPVTPDRHPASHDVWPPARTEAVSQGP